MSIHKSLALKDRLKRHRNVLRRSERIEALKKEGRWGEGASVFGLPKVRSIMMRAKAKAAKKEAAAEAGAEAAAPAVESAAAGARAAAIPAGKAPVAAPAKKDAKK